MGLKDAACALARSEPFHVVDLGVCLIFAQTQNSKTNKALASKDVTTANVRIMTKPGKQFINRLILKADLSICSKKDRTKSSFTPSPNMDCRVFRKADGRAAPRYLWRPRTMVISITNAIVVALRLAVKA